MRGVWLAIGLSILLVRSAAADLIDLVANDIGWDGVGTSPVMTIGLENQTSPPVDFLVGWQFRLDVVPEVGAVGTVTFNEPATTGSAPAPSGYILSGMSSGISVTNIGDELSANDFAPGLTGAQVPALGATLLDVDFVGAFGTFHVRAVPGLANTVLTDGAFTSRAFDNVPFAAGTPVVIGVITIPEPGTVPLIASAASLIGLARGSTPGAGEEGRASRI